jgi:hypothetical protein
MFLFNTVTTQNALEYHVRKKIMFTRQIRKKIFLGLYMEGDFKVG